MLRRKLGYTQVCEQVTEGRECGSYSFALPCFLLYSCVGFGLGLKLLSYLGELLIGLVSLR